MSVHEALNADRQHQNYYLADNLAAKAPAGTGCCLVDGMVFLLMITDIKIPNPEALGFGFGWVASDC